VAGHVTTGFAVASRLSWQRQVLACGVTVDWMFLATKVAVMSQKRRNPVKEMISFTFLFFLATTPTLRVF